MDAQSPSKRFIRGIPLHVENSVERPSFSLGLTQDFGEVSGSMSKSNTMQEIKSKLKNNPIRLEGMSAKSKQSNIKIVEGGKKDQSAAGSSKKRKEKTTNYTEENAKRKKVVVSGLLEHNEAVKFLGKREPTRIPHMQCYTNIEVMKVLATKLTISQYKEFCGTTCFAQLSSIRRCHVQAQLIRCMFLREIEGSSKDAILIHVNGTTLRFTIRDFAIITGLKCSDNEKDFVFNTEEPNRMILQYFGVEKAITKSQLVEKFDNKVWRDNDDDAVKFAILFYIHSFILSEEPTSTVIDRKDFDLVESGRYIDYPWGKKAFDLLILHLHTKIKHDGKYFRLYGFPLALQVWFYECCSNFDEEIAVKLVFKNITPTPMELKILELPPEYVQSDSSPTETAAANASDDDFQDPPCPINNKGKEKVDSCLSPPKKKSRQTVTPIQKKTTPRVISKQPCLIKSPRRANVAKRPKSPLPKRQAKKHANVPSYTGIKQNVEIKSSVPLEIPSTSKSHDFSISRDEFDQFKLSMEKQFTDLRNFIENNFKVVLDSIKSKNAEDKGDGVDVTDKVPVGVVQSEEPSQHLPSELNCQSVFNDLNDQEKVVRVSVPSSTPDVSIHQSKLHSLAGQSAFSPLVQQFSNPEPQGHNNSGVPINFKVQNTSNIFEVQNNSEKENCEDVPIEVVKEGSQFMDDQTDFNNSSFQDLLNVIHDQTEKMEKEEFSDTNKAGSSNVNELVVEEVLMPPAPLQMVHDDQPNINPERSMVLHPLLAVDAHTPLPIHRERRPGPFNTSPYVTSFGSESGSSSRFHFSFDLKHPFVAMSDLERTTLYIHFWKWLNEGLLVRHNTKNGKEERYKKNKSVLQMWFHFGIVTVQNKNWFYRLAYKNQLLDDSHVDVILYYIRKRAKYSDTNAFSLITVDCNFSNLITNVWDAYYNFESNINKESTEESIIEYINGYRMHVARPWHTVDNILIPVNIKEIFHWILIVVSINDRSIQIYDSLRGGALHDSSVENEIKKYAQLVPMYLSKSEFYGKKGIDLSSHPKYMSHSECDSFEMIYVNDIPQQDAGSLDCGLYVAAYADHISNGNVVPKSFDSEFTHIQYASLLWNYGVQKIQADATSDSEAPERPTRIHRDCDSSEKITIN
ncbi:uncharacterized protein LOC125808366 [Solanum verrucosum]|uniref:uncharacterized protein LOC125808366 n=1 Tax=Solanum verrucosum TaxID=315347 RepID=UPI0020D19DF4|nr:uncharacterized protein LOC125808366 [Solanum verrucosum]